METIFRICLFIAAIINIAPSILAFLPTKISDSYGINIPDHNYELLLRHRAVLFGIVGGIMMHSVFTKKHYHLSVIVGLASMISFLILTKMVNGEINPELGKVLKFDILGIVVLLFGFILYKLR